MNPERNPGSCNVGLKIIHVRLNFSTIIFVGDEVMTETIINENNDE